MKTCNKCLLEKEDTEFGKKKQCRDGLNSQCRQCVNDKYIENKEKKKEYHLKNKDRVKERHKEYYIKNKDKIREKRKEYHKSFYLKNQDRLKLQTKNYRDSNRSRIKEAQSNYHNNPINKQKINNRNKNRRKKDPLFALRSGVSCLIKAALTNSGYSKKSKTAQLLGCSYEDFLAYLGPKPDGDYHLDHICPNSQAQNEEEIIKLQNYTNFRWLSSIDNLLKSDNKTPEAEAKCRELLGREWI